MFHEAEVADAGPGDVAQPGVRAYDEQLRTCGIGRQAALRQLGNRLIGIRRGCLKPPGGQATSKIYNPLFDKNTYRMSSRCSAVSGLKCSRRRPNCSPPRRRPRRSSELDAGPGRLAERAPQSGSRRINRPPRWYGRRRVASGTRMASSTPGERPETLSPRSGI